MKRLTRREFLKLCAAGAIAVGGSSTLFAIAAEAFQKSRQSVVWVQGAGCAGCSSSMLNTVEPEARELLKKLINLHFHPVLTELQGFKSIVKQYAFARENQGRFILVVEGAIPKAEKGQYFVVGDDENGSPVALTEFIKKLGDMAQSVVALGSCACYGGLLSVKPNPLDNTGLDKIFTQNKVINIPGCPPHPDWVVGTLAHLILYGMPELDDYGRPQVFYRGLIHNNCPRRQYFDNSLFATSFGEEGCLLELGCKGPLTHGDCSVRLWNNGKSWCVQSGSPCIGCTEPIFPNLTMPFYTRMPRIDLPGINSTADTIGLTLGIATGVGLTAHLAGNALTGRLAGWRKKGGEPDE
ncbi:hydrogenase (NiFe) small subunit HydA [Thermincola ferriacetica]|uniref:Hydrogenase (NiFe) small subunit HydA n=1 Tax=Thermincola ferriacetica TaxID=281456 RepID=A0A0L6W2F0_9FIRM|nr:hydrogenase small subunit [Thermincola ferriacetica]KNZ69715.1 hydrogenase (NiFe) small subunit HydA [Thermincola ferriacetica]